MQSPTTLFKKVTHNKYTATIGDNAYVCCIGENGISENKKEGDKTTPVGKFAIRKLFYRPDQIKREDIKTQLPIQALSENDGWCDDSDYPEYNTYIKLPFTGSHEKLWREDHVYDLILVIGYNDDPVEKGKGSAIFIHIAREGYRPTAGCIGFEKNDLLKIISHLQPESLLEISKDGIKFKNCIEPINSPSASVRFQNTY